MSSRLTKKSLVSVPGVVGEHAELATARSWRPAPAGRRRGRSSRARSASAGSPGRPAGTRPAAGGPCRGSCGTRPRVGSSAANDSTSVCSCEASVRPGVNGHLRRRGRRPWPPARPPRTPPSTIRSASETCLPPACALLNACLDALQRAQHRRQLVGVVDLPAVLRLEADARAVGAAALVAAAERRGRRPRGRDQLRDRQARGEDLRLERGDVVGVDQLVVDRRAPGPARSAPRAGPPGRGSARSGPCRGGSA